MLTKDVFGLIDYQRKEKEITIFRNFGVQIEEKHMGPKSSFLTSGLHGKIYL